MCIGDSVEPEGVGGVDRGRVQVAMLGGPVSDAHGSDHVGYGAVEVRHPQAVGPRRRGVVAAPDGIEFGVLAGEATCRETRIEFANRGHHTPVERLYRRSLAKTGAIDSHRHEISEITAVEGEDYFVPGRRFITFGPGQRSARLLIPLVQDNVTEGDESFVIEINEAATDSNTNSRVAVTIRDDDSDPN